MHTVLAHWGLPPNTVVEPAAGGLINQTFLVRAGERRAVLQKVNAIFGPAVHEDIEAITAHLELHGVPTPRLQRTQEGALCFSPVAGEVWRLMTFLEGRVVHRVTGAGLAHAAGGLVARFHRAVATLKHTFSFSRPGAHDTPAHLAKLEHALHEKVTHPNFHAVEPVARAILTAGAALEPLPTGPLRIIHGDLKISNLLFDEGLTQGRALLDLDTLAHQTIPVELGDALRSWCNPAGEDAPGQFDVTLFQAAMGGYAQEAQGLLQAHEADALALGAQTISLELAARFCADALYENYFGWDARRFATRSQHNLVRAQSQLGVSQSVAAQRSTLEAFTRTTFSRRS